MRYLLMTIGALVLGSACHTQKTIPEAAPAVRDLTREKFEAARLLVQPHQPFDEALKRVSDKLGAPTRQQGRVSGWYARDETECHSFSIERTESNLVGEIRVADYGRETETFKNCH